MKINNNILFIITLFCGFVTLFLLAKFIFSLKVEIIQSSEPNNQRIIFNISNEKIISNNDSDLINYNLLNEKTKTLNIKTPVIAIIVKDLGLSKSIYNMAKKLPQAINFGISSYSSNLYDISYEAIQDNHDLLINLPLEPENYPVNNNGPHSLLTELSNEENLKRLEFLLNLTGNYQGFYTSINENFTKSARNSQMLLSALSQNNKSLIYSDKIANLTLLQIANKMNFNVLYNDIVIDQDVHYDHINEKLLDLENLALKKGYALGTIGPYPLSINLLEKWLASLKDKNITIVPISIYENLVKERENGK